MKNDDKIVRVKYPRTYHLPWSLGATSDDKTLSDCCQFVGRYVIVTEKMDGENTTLYSNGLHARSLDSRHHISRDWVTNFHASFAYCIPKDIRVCGENLYAKHSISYDNLPSYFLGFSVWEGYTCLPWVDCLEWLHLLEITPVRTLWEGIYDESAIKSLNTESIEGYVIRNASAFNYHEFSDNVAKFVRENHVQTDKHWMQSEVIPNKLQSINL